jgi:hypothetical protein
MNDLVAEIALDAFLAARYCVGDGLPEGRAWERAAGTLLQRPGLTRHQYAGLTTLFSTPSLSGCAHELDAAASGWRGCVLFECKSLSSGVAKSDVATFQLKTFDYYCGQLETAARERWWRLLISASPTSRSVRALCIRSGIILCDPERFPLPVLLRAAAHPAADEALPAVKLRELLRLAEPACDPMQQQWRIVDDEVRYRPTRLARQAMTDLLWLQDELSGDLFDAYDRFAPGRLERRIAGLTQAIRARERAHA